MKPYTIVEYAVFQLIPTAPKPFFEDVTKLQAKVHVLGFECEKEIQRLRYTGTRYEWNFLTRIECSVSLRNEKKQLFSVKWIA